MNPSLHRATGFLTDRQVARMPFLVKTASGRLLAGNHTEKGARKTARVIGNGAQVMKREVRR